MKETCPICSARYKRNNIPVNTHLKYQNPEETMIGCRNCNTAEYYYRYPQELAKMTYFWRWWWRKRISRVMKYYKEKRTLLKSFTTMLSLRFIPIFEDEQYITATKEYEKIWSECSQKVLTSLLNATGLKFVEDRIAIVVYEGISMSGRSTEDVMKLRASYDEDNKKGTLVHELGHRLIAQLRKRKEDIDEHQTLFLFLYDVWTELWGKDFADKMVFSESARKGYYNYEQAWKWALNLSKEDRLRIFFEIKGLN